MALLLGLLLAVVGVMIVLLPFWRRRQTSSTSPMADEAREMLARREGLYRELRTLQAEHELGEVSDTEFEERLRTSRLEAAEALGEQERLQQLRDRLERHLEEEVQTARQARKDGALLGAGVCPQCQRPLLTAKERCPHCGVLLPPPTSSGQDQHP